MTRFYQQLAMASVFFLIGSGIGLSEDIVKAAKPFSGSPVTQAAVLMEKGIPIPVLLQEPISTRTAQIGQPVRAIVTQDIFVGEKRVLSKNDTVTGTVSRIEPPIEGRNAVLEVTFDQLSTQSGLRMTLPTEVRVGKENVSYFGGETTPGTVPKVVPYHVYRIGTYGRVMYGGPRAMGTQVDLLPGTRIVLILTEPVYFYSQ